MEAHTHDIGIPRPKNPDIEIPRPKNHDLKIPRSKSHDIEIPRPKNHDIEIQGLKHHDIEKWRQISHTSWFQGVFFREQKATTSRFQDQKATTLSSCEILTLMPADNRQRSSPSRISDTPRAGFESAHNLSFTLVA